MMTMMSECPYCGWDGAETVNAEIAHMERAHPDVINERLAAIGEPPISITCPECGMTSYNKNDIQFGYCGNCHAYTGAPISQ
jgi:hypothetical protein